MKKTNTPKKPLTLDRATVRSLDVNELAPIAGASGINVTCGYTLCCYTAVQGGTCDCRI